MVDDGDAADVEDVVEVPDEEVEGIFIVNKEEEVVVNAEEEDEDGSWLWLLRLRTSEVDDTDDTEVFGVSLLLKDIDDCCFVDEVWSFVVDDDNNLLDNETGEVGIIVSADGIDLLATADFDRDRFRFDDGIFV